MELKDRIKNIVNYFEKIKEEDPRCGEVLCGTCGGFGSAIKESMSEEMINEVSTVLDASENMDTEDMQILYEWSEFLSFMYGWDKLRLIDGHVNQIKYKERMQVLYAEAKSIELHDIWEMDHFLFNNRYLRFNQFKFDNEKESIGDIYNSILKSGIELAIKSQNKSLSESIFIILGSDVSQYPQFIEKVLVVCPDRIVENYFKILPVDERETKRNSYNIKKQELEERKIAERKTLMDATYAFYKVLKQGDLLHNSISWNSRQSSWFLRRTLEEIISKNMTEEEVKEYLNIKMEEII